MKYHIAVVGSGLSGLRAATLLQEYGHDVQVFEKARGPGGRLATRTRGVYQFDFGAQFITAKTESFKNFLFDLSKASIVKRWDPIFAELDHHHVMRSFRWGDAPSHFVGYTKMNAIAKHLARSLEVNYESRVTKMKRRGAQWSLYSDDLELGVFDWIIVAIPCAQALALMPSDFQYHQVLESTLMSPCFSLMLGFENPLELPWQAALIHNADLSWISVNSHKPGRKTPCCLVGHATNDWAQSHLEESLQDIQEHLLNEMASVLKIKIAPTHIDLHRWRYANAPKKEGEKALIDNSLKLAVCGDWCIQGRAEAAYISGEYVAQTLLHEGI